MIVCDRHVGISDFFFCVYLQQPIIGQVQNSHAAGKNIAEMLDRCSLPAADTGIDEDILPLHGTIDEELLL